MRKADAPCPTLTTCPHCRYPLGQAAWRCPRCFASLAVGCDGACHRCLLAVAAEQLTGSSKE